MSNETLPTNVFNRLLTFTAAAFVVTVLALIAAAIGDQQTPFNRWLNRHAGMLLSVEVALTLLLGLVAMAVDGSQARKAQVADKPAPENNVEH